MTTTATPRHTQPAPDPQHGPATADRALGRRAMLYGIGGVAFAGIGASGGWALNRYVVDHVEVETIDQITLVLRSGRTVRWGSSEDSKLKSRVLLERVEVVAVVLARLVVRLLLVRLGDVLLELGAQFPELGEELG